VKQLAHVAKTASKQPSSPRNLLVAESAIFSPIPIKATSSPLPTAVAREQARFREPLREKEKADDFSLDSALSLNSFASPKNEEEKEKQLPFESPFVKSPATADITQPIGPHSNSGDIPTLYSSSFAYAASPATKSPMRFEEALTMGKSIEKSTLNNLFLLSIHLKIQKRLHLI
jgi:hypothetical protein